MSNDIVFGLIKLKHLYFSKVEHLNYFHILAKEGKNKSHLKHAQTHTLPMSVV